MRTIKFWKWYEMLFTKRSVYVNLQIIGMVFHGYTISCKHGCDILIPRRNTTAISEWSRRRKKTVIPIAQQRCLFSREIVAKVYALNILEEAMGDKETFKLLLFFQATGVIKKSSVGRFFSLSLGPHCKLQRRKVPARYNLSTTTLTIKDINGFTTTLIVVNYCTSMGYHDQPQTARQQWKVTSGTWIWKCSFRSHGIQYKVITNIMS